MVKKSRGQQRTQTVAVKLETLRGSENGLEWIWAARLLAAIAFASAGAMRLTLSQSDLLLRGDWTIGKIPPFPMGTALVLGAASLFLPRRTWGLRVALLASLLLSVFEVWAIFVQAQCGGSWWFDALRLALLSAIMGDAFLATLREGMVA